MRRPIAIPSFLFLASILTVGCGDTGEEFRVAPPDSGAATDTGSGGGSGSDASGQAGQGGSSGSSGAGGSDGGISDPDAGSGGHAGSEPDGSVPDSGDPDAGASGHDASDAPTEPVCDPTSDPSEDPCVIHEDFAIFVAPSGVDGPACGSRTEPCGSVRYGAMRGSHENKRTYVCGTEGTYAESVVIGSEHDGFEVYGGFDCSDWSHDDAIRTHVKPSDPDPALVLENVATSAFFDRFHFESPDATQPGGSSVAVHVSNSQGVVLRNCEMDAGRGANGSPGGSGANGDDGATAGAAQNGMDSDPSAPLEDQPGGSWPSMSACGSLGGKGGDGIREDGPPGESGAPQTGVTPPNVDNGGAGGNSDIDADPGTQGSNGHPGEHAAPPAQAGTFIESGFVPTHGSAGTEGHPGQGGGGGGAGGSKDFADFVAASGGAGGMGGCGGKGGKGGDGGGASVALVVWNSPITLDHCVLRSAGGGHGGDGGDGGQGGLGRPGGTGGEDTLWNSPGADGGHGGDGGPGGAGSGGTGGPSYGIAYKGAEPTRVNGTALYPGFGGDPGFGGVTTGISGTAPKGFAGDSQNTFAIP